ncbi:MAG TPA: PQQ-dependent sugar dehydrogenase [Gemmatimonadales bacterium]|nr:PQQ-dependent sugar dehydrogenase [Gemmatimonadales bacterium]
MIHRARRPAPRWRVIAAALACTPLPAAAQEDQSEPPAPAADWRTEWATATGFGLRRDVEGLRFPTALAFVPQPGPGPKDPLYFVTELQGTVKVVTNDRTVHTFATGVTKLGSADTLPAQTAEVGLAGLCLEPRHGYVFVTFAYPDSNGLLRNAVARFQSEPGRFGLTPKGKVVYTTPFARDVAAPSHQVGPCQATPTQLFVSVGDGEQPRWSQDLSSSLGKILRMDLDGKPLPTNPFFRAGSPTDPSAFIWARGFRNPFGLALVGTRLFAADNGYDIDRFVEVERGRNYLWDGNDRSIGAAALQVFAPSPAPVQLEYCPAVSGFPAEWRDRFFVAMSGNPGTPGPDARRGGKSVMALQYDFHARRMASVPQFLLRYRGSAHQAVVGLGCGPDGIYVLPIFADASGSSPVLVVSYTPRDPHPFGLATNLRPLDYMHSRGCFGCHSLNGEGGSKGPVLDYDSLVPRLKARLSSMAYRAQVRAVDSLPGEPFEQYREARARTLALTGPAQLHHWLRYHIQEPRFDFPQSSMPNLGVTDQEAVALAEYLLSEPASATRAPPPPRGPIARLKHALPKPRYWFVGLAFVVGAVVGGFGLRRLQRERRS